MSLTRSDTIDLIATALAKAQGEILSAKKDAENPHFKSDYSTLNAVREVCREPLSKNGIAVVQVPGKGDLVTMLIHSSGQWLASTMPILVGAGGNPAQAYGSALTYARRYGLGSMVGIASEEDDDGNAAGAPPKQQRQQRAAQPPKEQQKAAPPDPLEGMRKSMFAVGNEMGYSPEDIGTRARAVHKVASRKDLKEDQLKEMIEFMKANPVVTPPTPDELAQPAPPEDFAPLPFEKELS